jgi:spore cortex protein
VLSTVFLFAITGCGSNQTDDKTAQNRQNNTPMSVGYYSNENHEGNGGNAVILDGADNDGPVVEIMDHSFGAERNGNRHAENQNANPSGDAVIGHTDQNYHGHLSNTNSDHLREYYSKDDGDAMQKITEAVEKTENVKDAETIVNRNNVMIGVQLNNRQYTEDTIRNIQATVQPYLNGRKVQIFTNTSQYNRIRSMNNNLGHGSTKNQINAELDSIVEDNQ